MKRRMGGVFINELLESSKDAHSDNCFQKDYSSKSRCNVNVHMHFDTVPEPMDISSGDESGP